MFQGSLEVVVPGDRLSVVSGTRETMVALIRIGKVNCAIPTLMQERGGIGVRVQQETKFKIPDIGVVGEGGTMVAKKYSTEPRCGYCGLGWPRNQLARIVQIIKNDSGLFAKIYSKILHKYRIPNN